MEPLFQYERNREDLSYNRHLTTGKERSVKCLSSGRRPDSMADFNWDSETVDTVRKYAMQNTVEYDGGSVRICIRSLTR